MAWIITTPVAGLQPITTTDTVQNHALGYKVGARDTTNDGYGEFVYLLGVASTVAGDAVTYNQSTGATTRTVAGVTGPVAIAMSANVASQYGWYQVFGAATVNVAGAVSAGAAAYVTATAGSLDDAVVAGDLINDAYFAVAAGGAGSTAISLNYPSIA